MHAQVWDLASPDGIPSSIETGTVDIAIMIFVLSALHPDEWQQAVRNVWNVSSSSLSESCLQRLTWT